MLFTTRVNNIKVLPLALYSGVRAAFMNTTKLQSLKRAMLTANHRLLALQPGSLENRTFLA